MVDEVDVTKEGIVDDDETCGLDLVTVDGVKLGETGEWDPSSKVCKPHDLEFDANTEGKPNNGIVKTSADFVEGEAAVEAESLVKTVTTPVEALAAAVEDYHTAPTLANLAEQEAINVYGDVTPPAYSILATLIGIPLWLWEKATGKDPAKPKL